MTWIVDANGTRWVEPAERKRRAAPRALRFANLKVGQQIKSPGYRGSCIYYLVTDLWFDPVAGQADPIKGAMVGYQRIGKDGDPAGRKTSTTLRGLASQQFAYADIDYVSQCRARAEAVETGSVVPIAFGRTIRSRPKVPGARF